MGKHVHVGLVFFLLPLTLPSIFCVYKQKLGVKAPPVRIDSQAKYGALSRGDGAIYLRFPHKGYREKIWDHAAGCIVVTGTGKILFSTVEYIIVISIMKQNLIKLKKISEQLKVIIYLTC